MTSVKNVKRHNWKNVFMVLCSLVLVFPGLVQAKKLKDVIPGLYGGNGFQSDSTVVNAQAADFGISSLDELNALTNGIGAQLGQLAVNSTASSFRFDVERGVPVEGVKSLGPMFAERADTIGKGRFDFQVTWSHANYQRFNGDKLSNLETVAPQIIVPGQIADGETLLTEVDVEVVTNFVGFYGTYGILDNWDVNILIPLVHTKVKAKASSSVIGANGLPCLNGGSCSGRHIINGATPGTGDSANDSESADSTGIGDIFLRTKVNLLENHEIAPDLAVRGGVSFPTGDEDDFHGIGDVRFEGVAVASKYYPSPIGVIGPHANVGVSIVNNQSSRNIFTYIGGFDVAPIPNVAIFLDILGRHELDDKDNSGKNIIDISPGVKWAPWPHTLLQFGVQLPVNRNKGLRADQIWTVGLGGNF